ncbi:hypothetical protein KP509_1Z024700 [Ceratopteris richardii]|nr:hypothetical protein KP509_1Z024700 [Ceratopteris richardii]
MQCLTLQSVKSLYENAFMVSQANGIAFHSGDGRGLMPQDPESANWSRELAPGHNCWDFFYRTLWKLTGSSQSWKFSAIALQLCDDSFWFIASSQSIVILFVFVLGVVCFLVTMDERSVAVVVTRGETSSCRVEVMGGNEDSSKELLRRAVLNVTVSGICFSLLI